MANISRGFQDRTPQEGFTEVKQPVSLDTPPNCLSINRDCSQVVVAGRSVFKIFGIEEEQFVERINLRTVRNPNLTYCTADVAWNHGEDHILASASTNGSVVIWNLNMNSRSKQDRVFSDHKRTATRVNFHKHEHHLLISGSLDGCMKLFDLRKKEVIGSFDGKSDAIRDVQFNPHQYFQFAAAFDSGNVQVWDFRYPSRMEYQFTAHFGHCFSLNWHPDEPNWLASAGRDKMIKVWDGMKDGKPKNLHQIQTIASVAQIKWRPQRKHHIASCAFILDYNVNVWDIRRPYIPFAAFEDHKDVVTGIVWKHGDAHSFYTSSKDCTLQQHTFRSATRPADKANPVSVDISIHGAVGLATNDKLVNSTTKGLASRLPTFLRRGPDRTEQFTKVTSICNEFDVDDLSTSWLLYSARSYRLEGKSISELCEHNAAVSEQIGRHEVAQTWRMIKLFYGNTTPLVVTQGLTNQKQENKDADVEKVKTDKPIISQDAKGQGDSEQKEKHTGDISTGVSEEESDAADGMESDHLKPVPLTMIASGMGSTSHSDFFFGDGTLDQMVFDYDNLDNMGHGQDWNLPSEAFQPRFDIEERPTSPDPIAQHQGSALDSPSSANDSEFSTANTKHVTETNSSIKMEILGCPPFHNNIPTCNFNQIICDMLHRYADQGDVQMCVAVLIILGEKIQPHIDEMVQEQWLMSYIDLLSHFQLWCEAAEVIKLCNHPIVSQLNHQSTAINTNCSGCNKALMRGGWLCDRCKGYINTCSVCRLPVRGLYAWCQGCSHGGHLKHIQEWLAISKQCPAGCGHMCQYSM